MKSVAVKVSASGRLHLPSQRARPEGPGHVVITGGRFRDADHDAENLARIRVLARPYAPKDRLASEELIAERREQAAATT